MLTAELARVLRRSGRIYVPALRPAQKKRLLDAAHTCIRIVRDNEGRTRAELLRALDSVEHAPSDRKALMGLRKLLLDRCSFEQAAGPEPRALRAELFARAAAARRALGPRETFARESVIEQAARALDVDPAAIERGLFADLRENHLLASFDPVSAADLIARYEQASRQAVLLRATRVEVRIQCPDATSYRALFAALKFRRLLHTIEPLGSGGYLIRIDGPFSLFRQVTRYGLALALVLPVIESSGTWELDADVVWDRETLSFHLEGSSPAAAPTAPRLPDEVARLVDEFRSLGTPWQVDASHEILDVPGLGVCVPDLVFTHASTRTRVFLEVMGYWSRDAVWRRVELVEAGLTHPVVFALSSRLRVSEQVLGDELPGRLYVYKGTMSARAVLERIGAIGSQVSNVGVRPR